MRLYLLGRDIAHSLSPPMWNGVFARLGVDGRYGLLDLPEADLEDALTYLHEADVLGYNVTMPYKAWAAAQATEASADVQRCGTGNWITARGGGIAVANTDVEGARALLGTLPTVDRVLLLGAGGTAAAMLVALQGRAEKIVVANRSTDRSKRLVARESAYYPNLTAVPWQDRDAEAERAALIVNTTPLGMHDESSPLGPVRPRADARIYDVVYRAAAPTPLQHQAAAWGLPFVDGLAHLEAQAVALVPYFGLSPDAAPLVCSSLRAAAGRTPCRWWVPNGR
jgi:shikimate dehydrogenase